MPGWREGVGLVRLVQVLLWCWHACMMIWSGCTATKMDCTSSLSQQCFIALFQRAGLVRRSSWGSQVCRPCTSLQFARSQAMQACGASSSAAAAASSKLLQPLRDHHAATPNVMAALHGRERQLLTVMTLRQDLEDKRARLSAVQLTPASQAKKVRGRCTAGSRAHMHTEAQAACQSVLQAELVHVRLKFTLLLT